MRVVGTVVKVPYEDGPFAVAVVETDDQEISVSGEFPVLCPSMPFRGEAEERPHSAYGERWKLLSIEDPGVRWRRSSGVWTWLSSGSLGLGFLANELARLFGDELAEAVLDERDDLYNAVRSLGTEEQVEVLAKHSLSAQVAADLGEQGWWWLPGRLTGRYGPNGPLLAMSSLGSLVAQGVLPIAGIGRLLVQTEGEPGSLAVSICTRLRRLHGEPVISRKFLLGTLQRSLGEKEAQAALSAAIESGALLRSEHGGLVEASLVKEERAVLAALGKLHAAGLRKEKEQGGQRRSTRGFRAGVTLVDLPAGAKQGFVHEGVEDLRVSGQNVVIAAPDKRGSLLDLDLPSEPLHVVDFAGADCVIVLDAHRLTPSDLGRLVLDMQGAARCVLVGDSWLSAPGDGSRIFGELVEGENFPTVRMEGNRSSAALRRLSTRLIDLPQCHLGLPSLPALRLWPKGPTMPQRRVGTAVMLLEPRGGWGAGTVGTIESVQGDTCSLRVQGGEVVSASRLSLSADIPVGWLSGVRTERLVVGGNAKLPRTAWYAALRACEELYSGEPGSFEILDLPLPDRVLGVPVPFGGKG